MDEPEIPIYLEQKVDLLIHKYVIWMVKRGKDKTEGCGCQRCYNEAVDTANWYLRKSERTFQPEIDDIIFATIKDYYRHHKEDFHDDDDFRTKGLYGK